MPPAKRSTTKRRTTTRKKPTARKSPASKEPAAVARLNKSLDAVQDALTALRKDLTKDVGSSAKGMYKDLEKRIRDVRRDSGKLGKALQKDLEKFQKQLAPAQPSRPGPARAPSASRRLARRQSGPPQSVPPPSARLRRGRRPVALRF